MCVRISLRVYIQFSPAPLTKVDDLCRCGLGSSRDAGGEGKNGEHDEETHLLRWGTAFASSEKKKFPKKSLKISSQNLDFHNFLKFLFFFYLFIFFFNF